MRPDWTGARYSEHTGKRLRRRIYLRWSLRGWEHVGDCILSGRLREAWLK
jgi:hypothetical protein